MKIKTKDIKQVLISACHNYVSAEEAEYFAKLTIENHIKKYPRVNALRETVRDIEKLHELDNKSELIISYPKKAAIKFNFNSLPPVLKIKTVLMKSLDAQERMVYQ